MVRAVDLGEADRLLTILTPFHGTVRAVAKGARRPGSKLGGHLDLLRHVSLSVREGRSLDTVSQAETVSGFRGLHDDLGRLSLGLYLAELAERFSVEGAANPQLLRLLNAALTELEAVQDGGLLARWFEARLLLMSGFAPEVGRCVECGKQLEQQDHVFSAPASGILCPACRPSAGEGTLLPAPVSTVKLLRFLLRSDWPAVCRLRTDPDELRRVERIHADHLHYVLDRALRSAAFVDEVRSGAAAGPRRHSQPDMQADT